MGQTKNPDDGAAVATSIFIAVAVYGVSQIWEIVLPYLRVLTPLLSLGFPRLLRPSRLFTYPEQPTWSDIVAVKARTLVEAGLVEEDIRRSRVVF